MTIVEALGGVGGKQTISEALGGVSGKQTISELVKGGNIGGGLEGFPISYSKKISISDYLQTARKYSISEAGNSNASGGIATGYSYKLPLSDLDTTYDSQVEGRNSIILTNIDQGALDSNLTRRFGLSTQPDYSGELGGGFYLEFDIGYISNAQEGIEDVDRIIQELLTSNYNFYICRITLLSGGI